MKEFKVGDKVRLLCSAHNFLEGELFTVVKPSSNPDWIRSGEVEYGYVDSLLFELVEPAKDVWDGKGLPPVGTVCEYRIGTGTWFKCEIKYILKGIDGDIQEFVIFCPHLGFDQYVHTGDFTTACTFRPIRTPEQVAAEERENGIKAMAKILGVVACDDFVAATALYDAGYRKVEDKV